MDTNTIKQILIDEETGKEYVIYLSPEDAEKAKTGKF